MRSLIAVFLLVSCVPAFGQSSCLPAFTALQSFEWVGPKQTADIWRPLRTEGGDGHLIDTKARWHASWDQVRPDQLKMSLLFDPSFDGVSLPFNVYAVSVILDGQSVAWWDFTEACQGPGLSFFPGAEIHLPAVKLIGDKPQRLQIMVWGRI